MMMVTFETGWFGDVGWLFIGELDPFFELATKGVRLIRGHALNRKCWLKANCNIIISQRK